MKYLALLIALLFLYPAEGNEKIDVAVTTPFLAEFVRAAGGNGIEVTILLPPGASPHTYEPTPGQISTASGADLFVVAGSGIETEMQLLKAFKNSKVLVNASEGINLIDNDPHVWLSLRNAARMVDNICKALVEIDPQNRTEYEQNRDSYTKKLASLDAELGESLSGVEKILVFHGAWGYFCRDYGIKQLAIKEGGKEPTPARISEVIEIAKREGIKLVFTEPQEDIRYAELIAREIGGRVVVIDPLAENYIENMQNVAEAMKG